MTLKNLSNIFRMNQRTWVIICLKIILILQYLVLWQKRYKNKTKNKNKNSELVEEIKNRWSDFKDEIKKLSDEKNWTTR